MPAIRFIYSHKQNTLLWGLSFFQAKRRTVLGDLWKVKSGFREFGEWVTWDRRLNVLVSWERNGGASLWRLLGLHLAATISCSGHEAGWLLSPLRLDLLRTPPLLPAWNYFSCLPTSFFLFLESPSSAFSATPVPGLHRCIPWPCSEIFHFLFYSMK